MEGEYERKSKINLWIQVGIILVVIGGFLSLIIFSKTEANGENTIPAQFYETAIASWQMPEYKAREVEGIITMYNPVKWQCDDNPEITASGKRVEYGMIANNCLKFGTMVEINGEVFEIEDRMNSRYGCEHFDIMTFSPGEAEKFGSKRMTVKIYEPWH